MLNGVGHSRHVNLVTEVPDIDVHGSGSLVGLSIVNQESLELVGEADHAIGPIVQGRGLEVVGHQLRRAKLMFWERHVPLIRP